MSSEAPVVRPDVRDSPTCMNGKCGKSFGILRHKYPCKACGKTFCNSCSARTIALPHYYGYGEEPQRACSDCYFALAEMHLEKEGASAGPKESEFEDLEEDLVCRVRDFVANHGDRWKVKHDKKGVTIASATVEDSDFHSVRSSTVIKCEPEHALRVYTTKALWKEWQPEMTECKNLGVQSSAATELIYVIYRMPVIQNRDACMFSVTRTGVVLSGADQEQKPNSYFIAATSVDHPLAPHADKFVRCKIHLSYTTFTPVVGDDGQVHTAFESIAHVDPGGKVPAQVVNATLSRAIDQIAAMRDVMEKGDVDGSDEVLEAARSIAEDRRAD